jgi:glycosyltransferase involved in cell wall biosynthesis
MKLGLSSDIVIIGSASEEYIKARLTDNKITFRYNERWFKNNYKLLLSPRTLYNIWDRHIKFRNKNLYMLCASAYTSNDVSIFFAYPNKCYKWGYFTKVEDIDIDDILKRKQQSCIKLLWVGRFVKYKHPEMLIELAINLKKKELDFQIEMVGDGLLKKDIISHIKKNKLSNNVSLLGALPNDVIIQKMRESNVFIFTSDRNEGWGAVLNEAMSNGCAVVASHAIGSVPFLIENLKNGLIFESENVESLVKQVEFLINNRDRCDDFARNAYRSLFHLWSPKNAVENFVSLASSLLFNTLDVIELGPCSKAEPLSLKTLIKSTR